MISFLVAMQRPQSKGRVCLFQYLHYRVLIEPSMCVCVWFNLNCLLLGPQSEYIIRYHLHPSVMLNNLAEEKITRDPRHGKGKVFPNHIVQVRSCDHTSVEKYILLKTHHKKTWV